MLVIGYFLALPRFISNIGEEFKLGTGLVMIMKVARAVIVLMGWVLLIVAFARSSWDDSVFSAAWSKAIGKALATLPAAAAAAMLTALIVILLPNDKNTEQLRYRIGNVFICILLTGLSTAGVLLLTITIGDTSNGGFAAGVYALGYATLGLIAAAFLVLAVATSFGASWTHRRAGGISNVLFAIGLLVSYHLLALHGPVTTPLTDEPVTTAIIESELGLYGTAVFFIAGVLGIFASTEDTSEVEADE